MSDLQLALLAIGLGVIVLVYSAGWWQQRQYQRKFGEAFKAKSGDALYPSAASAQAEVVAHQIDLMDKVIANEVETASLVTLGSNLDESCTLMSGETDFMIELSLSEASSAQVLALFWSRRFDFSKPVQVCGFNMQAQRWERVIADSQTLYSKLRLALQLADRSGVVNLTKLADFRDLVLGLAHDIQAEISVPDLAEAHQCGVLLDAWCAEVDQMVGVNLVAPAERLLRASRVAEAAHLQAMRLESDGAFHVMNAAGNSLFRLINQDNSPFQHHTLAQASSSALTLLLDVPRNENPVQQFALMCEVARALADELQLSLVDDQRVVLTASGLELIRAQIAAVELNMLKNGIAPGSAQARRLFS
ncbi:MAG: hypothetical protein RL358_1807 [Pseudomonadota bacterium]|jgi:hypothetical protein